MKPKPYRPTAATAALLDAAMEHIRSVDYPVGLRWVFYRLLQDGLLSSKDDYGRLKDYASRARKAFYRGWRPWTLVDEGREVSESTPPTTREEELAGLHRWVSLAPNLFEGQECVPFLLFEAATMVGQFHHYAPWADQAALRGDASIPHKWNIARRMDELAEAYGLPIEVLYFGDYDAKGLVIPESAMADIRAWTDAEVRFTRCGIGPEQAERYGLPEKPEKPGTYEWESLSHEGAGEIILGAIHRVFDVERMERAEEKAKVETEALQAEVRDALAVLL